MGWDQAPQSELYIPSNFGPSNVGYAILAPENIPAELQALYPAATFGQAMIWQKDSQDYDWQLLVIPNVGEMFVAYGSRNASTGVARELYRVQSPLAGTDGQIRSRVLWSGLSQWNGPTTVDGRSFTRGWLDGVLVTTSATLATTVGNTEVDIPNLALTATLVANRVYGIFSQARAVLSGTTGDDFQMKWRRDTALTGTIIGEMEFSGFNLVGSVLPSAIYFAPANETVNFFCSCQRVAGATDTCAIVGSPGSNISRTWAGICDLTDNLVWRTS